MAYILTSFSLRPAFVGWITLLAQLPLQIFFTFWAGLFFGGLLAALGPFEGSVPFIVFGAVAFVGIPIVTYIGKRLNYAQTEYRFKNDQIEFEEGYFSINRKVLKLSEVKEVTLHKGFLQRACGLGSIYLATRASGSLPNWNLFRALGFGNISGSGILVQDIQNPDEAFEQIRALVDAYHTRN